jgi:hypothetical protein
MLRHPRRTLHITPVNLRPVKPPPPPGIPVNRHLPMLPLFSVPGFVHGFVSGFHFLRFARFSKFYKRKPENN